MVLCGLSFHGPVRTARCIGRATPTGSPTRCCRRPSSGRRCARRASPTSTSPASSRSRAPACPQPSSGARAHTHTHTHPRGSAAFLVSSPSLSPSPAVACWWLWSLAPPRSPAVLLDNHGSAYFRVSISESCGIYASSHGIFRVIRPAVSRSGPRIAAMPREHVSRSRQDGRVEASLIGSSHPQRPPGPGGESRPLDGPDKARRARQGLDPAGRAASTGSRHPKTPGRVC